MTQKKNEWGRLLLNGDCAALAAELEASQASEATWQALFDGIATPTFLHDAEYRIVQANRAYFAHAGLSPSQVLGKPYWMIFPRLASPLPHCSGVLEAGETASEDRFSLDTGEVFSSRGFVINDAEGNYAVSVHFLVDVTEQARTEQALLESEEKFRLVTEAVRDVFWLGRADNSGFEYVSPAFVHLWGLSPETLYSDPDAYLRAIHPDDAQDRWQALANGEARFRLNRPDGSTLWVQECRFPVAGDDPARVAGVVRDISEQKRFEAQLLHQGTHDQLTGLPNRELMRDRLELAIAAAHRHGQMVGVCFIDLDRFKVINDSLGHSTGDRVLEVVAERLRRVCREADTVARQGGDEFVVILPELEKAEDVIPAAQRILASMEAPILWQDKPLELTLSMGVCVYPRDGEDVETLLRNADTTMYQAKDSGRNNYKFFTQELNARVLQRLTLEGQLRRALERDELELYYQPQVDLNTGYVTGTEALLRWNHPELGVVGPDQFIAIAEESGLIEPIGGWVLRRACRQAREWQDLGLPPLVMSVNVSARQLASQGVSRQVRQVLEEEGLEPEYLELELTETLLASGGSAVMDELRQLKQQEVMLALDDFGTGYSSLAYLQRYPFDTLKIDLSFIRGVTTNPDNATITRTIISMAHCLGLKVVAEGVEEENQANYLRRHGCDVMQGYFYSRPVSAEAMETLLAERRQLPATEDALQGAQRTLLIVDDEPNVAHALERVLRKDGYRILQAVNAAEGMELLARYGAAVVISDQRMPEMSGVDFLSRVKEIHPSTLRMVLTGYPDVETVTRAINSGAVYKFLTKPWDDGDLAEIVREAFRTYQMRASGGQCG